VIAEIRLPPGEGTSIAVRFKTYNQLSPFVDQMMEVPPSLEHNTLWALSRKGSAEFDCAFLGNTQATIRLVATGNKLCRRNVLKK
jgi:hypothetical protein